MIDPKLIRFYENSTYFAETNIGDVLIRIHENVGKNLSLLMDNHKVSTWAFITAWNPRSLEKSTEENLTQNKKLKNDISVAGYEFFPGEGKGDDCEWAPEPGFLVLGIPQVQALYLGRKYRQNAIVYGERKLPAQLLFC